MNLDAGDAAGAGADAGDGAGIGDWGRLFARRTPSLIHAIHEAFRTPGARRSPSTLTAFCIRRIDALNLRGPCLSAILEVNPDLRPRGGPQGAAVPRGRPATRGGETDAPLWGLPLVLKDNIATATDRLNTTCGSHFLIGTRARSDATIVARARAAGALMLAKANMYEFGVTVPGGRGGPVRNPFDGGRTQPGGSSNGVAVAVASGMAVAGWGTDARGSIRTCCSECGLAGLRPTPGLISRHGICAFELVDVAGPLARSVADLALLLGPVAAAPDARDPVTALYEGARRADYAAPLRSRGLLRGLRLATRRGLRRTLAPALRARYDEALRRLREAGAILVPVEADIWPDAAQVHQAAAHPAAQALAAASLQRFADNWTDDSELRSLEDLRRRLRTARPTGLALKGIEPASLLALLDRPHAVENHLDVCRTLLARLRAPFLAALARAGAEALIVPTGSWAVPVDGPLTMPIVRHDYQFGVLCGLAGLPELVVPLPDAPRAMRRRTASSAPSPASARASASGSTAARGAAPADASVLVPAGLSWVGRPHDELLLLQLGHAFAQIR